MWSLVGHCCRHSSGHTICLVCLGNKNTLRHSTATTYTYKRRLVVKYESVHGRKPFSSTLTRPPNLSHAYRYSRVTNIATQRNKNTQKFIENGQHFLYLLDDPLS